MVRVVELQEEEEIEGDEEEGQEKVCELAESSVELDKHTFQKVALALAHSERTPYDSQEGISSQ